MSLYIPFNEFLFSPLFCPHCFSVDFCGSVGSFIPSQPILSISLCKNISEIFRTLSSSLQFCFVLPWVQALSALLMLHKNKL